MNSKETVQFLNRIYGEGMTLDELRSNIQASQETEIGFSTERTGDGSVV